MKETKHDNGMRDRGKEAVDEHILAEGLKVAWDNFDSEGDCAASSPEEQQILARTKQRIDSIIDRVEKQQGRGRFWRVWGTVAAILLPLLVVSAVWLAVRRTGSTESPCAMVSTAAGERATLMLADGTEVVLNQDSRIEYAMAAGEGRLRSVSFSGEAYFNVSHLENDIPFEINTDAVTVRVLGTAFNIVAPDNASMVEVSLDSGCVEMVARRREGMSIKLSPGQVGLYDCLADSFNVVTMPWRTASGWLRHRMEYNGVSPDSLIDDLERTYAISVPAEVRRSINEPFTGSLPDNDLHETVMILSKIYHFPMADFFEK